MRREAGFTLVEMLAVLTVIGLLAAVAATGASWWRGPALDREAARVAAALRLARTEAVARSADVVVRFDAEGEILIPGLGWRETLAALPLARADERPVRTVAFGPEGRADIAALRLRNDRSEVWILIDALTGRVDVRG